MIPTRSSSFVSRQKHSMTSMGKGVAAQLIAPAEPILAQSIAPLHSIHQEERHMGCLDIPNETIFTMEMTPIKFGPGATEEVPYDLKRLGVHRTLLVTDSGLMKLGLAERVRVLIQEAGIAVDIFDDVHIEPTDRSFEQIAS